MLFLSAEGFLHFMFLLRKARALLAVFVILVAWGFHERSLDISTPRYLAHDTKHFAIKSMILGGVIPGGGGGEGAAGGGVGGGRARG